MDNRIFNVNGRGKDALSSVLRLAFQQDNQKQCKAWAFDKKLGLILLWLHERDAKAFPSPLSPEATTEMVWEWLSSDEASEVICEGGDANADHDGHNTRGWRVYCEGWGFVGEWRYAIVAVKPAYLWHGK